jgi:quinol monooxygenase YgiN
MIIVTAKMTVKPEMKEVFILESKDLISSTRKEKGCISYDLYINTENKNELIMLENWDDIDSLNKHMETDHFKKFGSTLKKFLTKEIEIKTYPTED